MNGVVTVISINNGMCLDIGVLSKSCKSCQHWSKKKDHPKYLTWKEKHICSINHTKSAGSMESIGLQWPCSKESG